MKEIKASVITIGDELLIGQTLNTNSAWIGRELNKEGIWLTHSLTIGDEEQEIVESLKQESAVADVILVTGGLGPTDDDKTKSALCAYFNSRLKLDQLILDHIKKRLALHGGKMLESNRAQALVPDNCDPLFNEEGTAPGMWFEKEGKVFVSMPGVPHEMKALMKKKVLPLLAAHFKTPAILHHTVITSGIPESRLAEKLKGFEHSLPPHIKLAYLPGNGFLKLRLTARGEEEQRVAHELDQYGSQLKNRAADHIIATDDLPLAAIVGNRLKKKGLSVGTAESCTGGYVGHLFTSVAGSSDYFQGAMVTYTNELKTKLLKVPKTILKTKGAVSEEVVKAMVTGLVRKLGVDVGIAVSGIMGPSGGSPGKPVGTVWLAAGNEKQLLTRVLHLRYDRLHNIRLTGNYALLLLLDFLAVSRERAPRR